LKLCDNQGETKNKSKSDTSGADDTSNGVLTKFRKLTEGVSNFLLGEQPQEHNSLGKQEFKNNTDHKMDDRVWAFINDKLYGGYLKYIGRVPGDAVLYAGIQLVSTSST
jgi:hypothetical protein